MGKERVLGAIAGGFIYLVLICVSLGATTFYSPPKEITPILPWSLLGLAPLTVVFGQYLLLRDRKPKREIKLGFCGYILWLAMLILFSLVNFEIDECHSILIGYVIILAIVFWDKQTFSRRAFSR